MVQERHYLSDHIEAKVLNLIPEAKFRHYDLEDTTDDPGHTGLYLTYIYGDYDEELPFNETLPDIFPDDEFHEAFFEDEGKGGPGEYEEMIILHQNNEVLIIVNRNY
jgi:hypothetical protein